MMHKQSGPLRADTGTAQENHCELNSTPSPAPDESAVGELRKQGALEFLHARNPGRVTLAQWLLLRYLLKHGKATIDDIRQFLCIADGESAKWLGAVPQALVRAGIIRRAEFRNSARAAAHARPVTVWEIADADAARAWLAAHPDAGA